MKKIKYALFMIMALSLMGCNNDNSSASLKPSTSDTISESNSSSVTKPTLIGISIEDYPLKTEYEVNEELDIAGMTIKLNYSNQTNEVIGVIMSMVTKPDMTTTGEKTVTITYLGFTASYKITIKNASVKKEKPTINFLVDEKPFENGTQFEIGSVKDIVVNIPELTSGEYEIFYTKDEGKTNLGSIAPTEIGKYAINVKTFETSKYEASEAFRWYEIIAVDNRLTPTFSFSIESGVIFEEGKVPEILATANEEDVQVEIYYTKDDGATNLGKEAPKTPGTYAINIKSIADEKYKEESDFRWYIIKPSNAVDIQVTFSDETEFTYDGNPHTPRVISITNNVDYKVHYEKGEGFYSEDAPTEKGSYSMVVSLVNESDGTLVRPWWCPFTIN